MANPQIKGFAVGHTSLHTGTSITGPDLGKTAEQWNAGEISHMPGATRSRTLSMLSALLLSSLCAFPTQAQIRLDLPAQPLGQSLTAVGTLGHLNVMFDPSLVDGLQAPAIKAEMSPDEALSKLLSGTNLHAVRVNANTIRVTINTVPSAQEIDGAPDTSAVLLTASAGVRLAYEGSSPGIQGVAEQQDERSVQSQTDRHGQRNAELIEVVVTGTHIRGIESSAGSKPIVIDRTEMENSGYASVPDVLKALPQNFSGGVGEAQSPLSLDASANNFNRGTAVNLRGLGADSTLILINGHRQPASGVNGAFVDVSGIPATAIEKIEILPDGSSAIYGSDAVGGVVNFILRNDLNGAETTGRVGTYGGDGTEVEASQLFGNTWSSGSLLLGYQYYHRADLPKAARPYTASDDLRSYGGSDFRSFDSNPGNVLGPAGLAAFAIPRGQNGLSLTSADLRSGSINYFDSAGITDLLPDQAMHSVVLNLKQRVAAGVELFSDARFSTRTIRQLTGADEEILTVPSSNPFYVNPFGNSRQVRLGYNFAADLGTRELEGTVDTYMEVAGFVVSLPREWQVEFSGGYGTERTRAVLTNLADTGGGALTRALADSNPATAFNPFGDGSHTNSSTLDFIRATQVEADRSYLRSANITADGKMFSLPGGSARLALGLDYRNEDIGGTELFPGHNSRKSLGRSVSAAFLELAVPIVGPVNSHVGVNTLDVSIAGRYERYSDFGKTFNPKFGLKWNITGKWSLRGTWGTAFRAPRLIQLLTTYPNSFDFAIPLASPSGTVPSLVRYGNNSGLKEQTAHVWTVAIDYGTQEPQGFKGTLSAWDVDYLDVIAAAGPAGSPFRVLSQPVAWANVITFNPTAAQVAAICNGPTLFGSVSTCLAGHYGAIVDLRLQNLTEEHVRGLDVDLRYQFTGSFGRVRVGLLGTLTSQFDVAVTSAAPVQRLLNTIGNVPRLRLRGNASWGFGGFDAILFLNRTGSYTDNVSVPNRTVAAWTTADVTLRYKLPEGHGWFDGMEASVSAVNVFNRDPPFANVGSVSVGAYGYDTANANPYGRVLSLQLAKLWNPQ